MPNVGGHENAYDHVMEIKVTLQLITQDANCCQQVIEKTSSRHDKCQNCGSD